jgi:hypothetical protein
MAATGSVYLAGLLMPSIMPAEASAAVKATIVWYLEQEAGTERFKVRYIVTPDYLRSDEGGNGEGYVLLVRKEKRIYNVVPDNGTVLEIDGDGSVPSPPASLSMEVREAIDENAPRLEGKTALTLELIANDVLCRSAVVVPGLLDDVRQAFGEFQRVLAVQQARTVNSTEEEFRTPCFLADSVYFTDYHLGRGIPLLEWRADILNKELLDYETGVELPESLFELPKDYHYFSAPTQ